MVAYLDSSVVLRHILLGEIAIRHAMEAGSVVSSELIEIECRRVLHRYRLTGELDDDTMIEAHDRLEAVLRSVTILALTDRVKARAAAAFPVVVKTLDALHLATALVYADQHLTAQHGESILVFSHDESMNRCAHALGLPAPFRKAR